MNFFSFNPEIFRLLSVSLSVSFSLSLSLSVSFTHTDKTHKVANVFMNNAEALSNPQA